MGKDIVRTVGRRFAAGATTLRVGLSRRLLRLAERLNPRAGALISVYVPVAILSAAEPRSGPEAVYPLLQGVCEAALADEFLTASRRDQGGCVCTPEERRLARFRALDARGQSRAVLESFAAGKMDEVALYIDQLREKADP